MEIKEIKISQLKEYENNPRNNDAAVQAVAASIEEFGFKVPIVVDKDRVIVAGHTRLKAAKSLGMETVPCIVADDLTDEQIKAFRLADNKTAELALWDFEKLQTELDGILDIEMGAFGFEVGDFEVDKDIEEDEVPEVDDEAEPTVKLGQVWKLGRHRLMCGDSTSKEQVGILMDGKQADLLVTDPPYNVAYEGKTADALTIENDSMGDSDFLQFLKKAFEAADSAMRTGAAFYIWHADSEGYNFRSAAKLAGWKIRQCLVWVKNTIVLGRQDYQWKHEPCLYGWKEGAAHYFKDDRTEATVIEDKINVNKLTKAEMKELLKQMLDERVSTTVLYEDKPAASHEHPTMKPVKLLARQIKNSSKRGQLVLDLFGGSGTTLIACEQLERSSCIMELDPKYCDVIIKRWETLTGEKAELIQ